MGALITILIILIILLFGFLGLWIFCKIAGNTKNLEEQMEIERKLRK